MINLADVQRSRRMDVTRPRLEPVKMLRVGGSLLRDLLRVEQRRDATCHREIGRRSQACLLAAGADLGHNRGKWRCLQHQPLLPQCPRDDNLDGLLKTLLPSPIPIGQERRHRPIGAIARQQIVDLAGREAQLGRRAFDCRPARSRTVENSVKLVSDTARRQPGFVGAR